jgi:predicted dehydrogenase
MMKWGVIGCGDIAVKRVFPAIQAQDQSELHAVSRRNPDALAGCAKAYGIPKTYSRWRDLCADDDIDAVYVATPVSLHAEQAIAALEQGKHVLCEKPMAYDSGEARRMIDAASAAGRHLAVAYYRRFYPMVERIRILLAEGAIGTPVYVHAENCEAIDPAPGEPRRWLLERELSGGGPLMDMGCHRLDIFAYLFGERSRPLRAEMSRNILIDRDVEDTALVQMEFDTGCRADLFCSHAVAESRDSLDIYGSEGSIRIPVLNGAELILVRGDGSQEVQHLPPHENVHFPLVDDFVRAVQEGRKPMIDGEQGIFATKMLDQAYGRADG